MTNDQEKSSAQTEKSQVMIWILFAVAIVVLYVVIKTKPLAGISNNGIHHPAVGKQLGALELEPITGSEQSVGLSDLKGKVTLINYWATWCGPCVKEFPHMVALEKKYRHLDDFQMLSVSESDHGKDREALHEGIRPFLKKHHAQMPIYTDPNGRSFGATDELHGAKQLGIPATLVLDRQGVVQGFWFGYATEEEIAPVIEEVLNAEGE